jgi:hypothetical protein
MDLILALEQIFDKIKNQLDSNIKVDIISNNYSNDLEAIHSVFDSTKEKKYENGLNKCRDEMLKQLIQKRNEQLDQVNLFIENSQQNNLTQLKSHHKSIKQKYVAFAKGFASVFESILLRINLTNPLKLSELVKYAQLMSIEPQVCLAGVKHLLDHELDSKLNVHVIPSSLILLYCPYKKNIIVLNKSGDLIHFKKLQKEFKYDVQLNATNIIAYNTKNRIVEIYNFKLELVHSIRLERNWDGFKLNKYDIALSNRTDYDQYLITCYNYETTSSKKKEIYISTVEFKRILGLGLKEPRYLFQLVDLNDRFIFIEGWLLSKREPAKYIFMLNRHDNNNIFKYFECDLISWVIYKNQIGSISRFFFQIYETDASIKRESIKNVYRIESIYTTSNYKYIFFKRFDVNNLSLEFYLY